MNAIKINKKSTQQKEKSVKDAVKNFAKLKNTLVRDLGDGKNYNGIYNLQEKLKRDDRDAHNRNMSHIRSFITKMTLANKVSQREFKITSVNEPVMATKQSMVSSLYSNPEKHRKQYETDLRNFTDNYQKYHTTGKDVNEIPTLDEHFC